MSGDPDPAGPAYGLSGWVRWAALAAFAAFTVVAAVPLAPGPPAALAAASAAAGAAALLLWGRRPQLLWAAVATAGLVVLADGRPDNVGLFAVYLAEMWCLLTGTRWEGLACWAAITALFAAEWLWVRPDPGWGAWLAGVFLTALFCVLVRHQRNLLTQLRAAQASLSQQARMQERNRIARELHDIIGHSLTVSLLHVQSARLAVEHDPAGATRALAEAERLSRECLTEVRTTVGMLREDDAAGGLPGSGPLPGMADLTALVEQFRSAGAEITYRVEGDAGGLPATAGLAIYRILQEALTNAARHAPGSPTEVRLAVSPHEVTLTADSQAVPGTGNGLGLVSMRERAESVGGTCQAGPGGHGWLVRATLPLAGTAS